MKKIARRQMFVEKMNEDGYRLLGLEIDKQGHLHMLVVRETRIGRGYTQIATRMDADKSRRKIQ